MVADFVSFARGACNNLRMFRDIFANDEERRFDVMGREQIEQLRGKRGLGPSSKVIAMYGPSTCTALKVICGSLEAGAEFWSTDCSADGL